MIYALGFLAQICFSARLLIQWIISEKEKQVVSPTLFWLLSLLGSYLLFFYGWLRNDFAIILGQLISYYIYIWNLNMKNSWQKIPVLIRYILLITPIVAIGYMLAEVKGFINQFFYNENIPFGLLLWGSLGQIIFTLRFVYQWVYSRRHHDSILPIIDRNVKKFVVQACKERSRPARAEKTRAIPRPRADIYRTFTHFFAARRKNLLTFPTHPWYNIIRRVGL